MELFKAAHQWANRPSDERFETLQELYNVTKAYAEQAREASVPWSSMRVEADGSDVQLVGKTGIPAKFTHWAFGQLCARVQSPAGFLRELPATLASQVLNNRLATVRQEETDKASLMFHQNGGLVLRACTSEMYSRIWNWEIGERLLNLQARGWQPAKPDKHWPGQVPVGTCISCEGSGRAGHYDTVPSETGACKHCRGTGREFPALYASDHDMFAFVTNRNAVIREEGNPDGLVRGVIVENSEVGAGALKMTRFLYREMCGNHIIWNASKVTEISVRHVGRVHERFSSFAWELKKYSEASASDDEAQIASAKTRVIGATKEDVLDALFSNKRLDVSRKVLEASYEAVKPSQDGPANTVWGFVQGMTRHSQTVPYADQRTKLDKAAGKVLEIAF